MRHIALLGATGSIGSSTLDLIARHPDRYALIAASADRNWQALEQIVRRFSPSTVALSDPSAANALREALGPNSPCTVLSGVDAHVALAQASDTDTVVAGIVGLAGLASTFAAVSAGKRVLIANKEPLVAAGALLLEAARRSGAVLLPLDSEHNAVLQCWPEPLSLNAAPKTIQSITLTASGGPFLTVPRSQLANVTPAQAIKHPRWSMGPKISVDSATLMNKGLEVIEAQVLFGLQREQIQVLIHPQSTVHALVSYCDGSSLAQLGAADMRVPIAHALGYPQRIASGAPQLDLAQLGTLSFSLPDLTQFPCLALAFAAAERGDAAPLVLNAANEAAVAGFLNGQIGFLDIDRVISTTMERAPLDAVFSVDAVIERDQHARCIAITAF
jgi:1-deoxy-D-xylulose-5-phosphate reductoisomerase